MKQTIKISFSIALLFFIATSCQKVIDVDLNNSNPQYIIEGEVTDAPGPYFVQISRSKNFDENNNFPSVSGAVTIITDLTSGLIDTLTESSSGIYQTHSLQGVLGHTYKLDIFTGDQSFTATATIPLQAVEIDSLYVRKSDFGGDDYFMVPVYTDPSGKGNRYLIRQYVNGQLIKGTKARSDEVTNGETSDFPLYYGTDSESGNPVIHNGDTMKAELLGVNQDIYDFYRTLDATIDQNSGTPSNPLSNIKGGAMGIFKAGALRSKSVVAQF